MIRKLVAEPASAEFTEDVDRYFKGAPLSTLRYGLSTWDHMGQVCMTGMEGFRKWCSCGVFRKSVIWAFRDSTGPGVTWNKSQGITFASQLTGIYRHHLARC